MNKIFLPFTWVVLHDPYCTSYGLVHTLIGTVARVWEDPKSQRWCYCLSGEEILHQCFLTDEEAMRAAEHDIVDKGEKP